MACIALSHNAHSECVASCLADWKGVFKHTSIRQCKIFVRPVATLLVVLVLGFLRSRSSLQRKLAQQASLPTSGTDVTAGPKPRQLRNGMNVRDVADNPPLSRNYFSNNGVI